MFPERTKSERIRVVSLVLLLITAHFLFCSFTCSAIGIFSFSLMIFDTLSFTACARGFLFSPLSFRTLYVLEILSGIACEWVRSNYATFSFFVVLESSSLHQGKVGNQSAVLYDVLWKEQPVWGVNFTDHVTDASALSRVMHHLDALRMQNTPMQLPSPLLWEQAGPFSRIWKIPERLLFYKIYEFSF